MNKKKLILLSVLSGLILSFAWWDLMFAPLMLVAFVPLLLMEDGISNNLKPEKKTSWKVFLYSYPAFLLWNATTVYWITYSTPLGVAIPFFEAALMSLTFQLAHFCKRSFAVGKAWTDVFFAIFFLAFEQLQLNWDLNFPWLASGNSFAKYPALVQWYEYTGVAGGSLWIWLCNIAIFALVKSILKRKESNQVSRIGNAKIIICLLITLLPITISLIQWFTYTPQQGKAVEVIAVQPNLDPYNEQYDFSPRQVCDKVVELTSREITPNTDFVLCPESCLQDYAWEERIESSPSVDYLRKFQNQYPKAEIIAGMSSRRILPEGVVTKAARPFRDVSNRYYECCNIAIKIDRDTNQSSSQLRHKSVLTPFVEKMPFKSALGFLGDLALDLGGTVGTLGTDEKATLFTSEAKPKTATMICYESVDGEYVAEFVRKGAEILFIITNDGWWKDSPGHRQHAAFARLRAIETRRPIARSANTGISCFVSPKGEQTQQTAYWEEAVIKQELIPQNKITFYATYGNYIYRAASFLAVLFLLLSIVSSHLRKKEIGNLIKTQNNV